MALAARWAKRMAQANRCRAVLTHNLLHLGGSGQGRRVFSIHGNASHCAHGLRAAEQDLL